MANLGALSKISWILDKMRHESEKRDAPVLRAEAATDKSPFKILVFTMLSSRTKDETTIKAIYRLFSIEKADSPKKILALGARKLERILYGVGFYRVKTRNLLAICAMLADKPVPDTIECLLALPGVGRKTANIVLARAFGKNTIGVDVHVHRISNRLGIVKTNKPIQTERTLVRIIPKKHIRSLNRDFVAFGQTVCIPRKPMCRACPINRICFRVGITERCAVCSYGAR